jgi:hypothetical protein
LQPRDINNRKGEVAEPIMSRRRQQTVPQRAGTVGVAACGETADARTGWGQDTSGVWRAARSEGSTRNRRGPTRRPASGEGVPYKPSAKGGRGGRESEGLVVPWMAETTTLPEGRSPALVTSERGGKCEGMSARTNHPTDKARELQPGHGLGAKQITTGTGVSHLLSPSRNDAPEGRVGDLERTVAPRTPQAATIGKPCAGNPQARFERGMQEPGP